MKTEQEIFNIVSMHLLKQGEKSCYVCGAACVYLNDNGLKCAIGCLIPKSAYKSSIEELDIYDLFNLFPEVMEAAELDEGYTDLLNDLQHTHDCHKADEWAGELFAVAIRFGLTYIPSS